MVQNRILYSPEFLDYTLHSVNAGRNQKWLSAISSGQPQVTMVFQFLVRLRTYSVSFVSFVVENVACLLFITKWLRTFTTEAQSALRTHRGVCYSITHSIPRGASKMI